jgi:hypothetical protein
MEDFRREPLANGEEADFVRKLHHEAASVKEAAKRGLVRAFFFR